MPCTDYGYERAESQELRTRLDSVTNLLCSLCKNAEKIGVLQTIASISVKRWWENHKEQDKRRLYEERRYAKEQAQHQKELLRKSKAKKEVLAKLSEKERKILGL